MSIVIIATGSDPRFDGGPARAAGIVAVVEGRVEADEKIEQLARQDGGASEYHLVDANEVIPVVEVQDL